MKSLTILPAGLLALAAATTAQPAVAKKKPAKKLNVLMIIVDDLRPELGCYGNAGVLSPNIDALAARGVRFGNAYCNVPVSGSSRASLLTGLRPAPGRFTGAYAYAQQDAPGTLVLPQHFKNNGYLTISDNKVFHHQDDCKEAWDYNWRAQGRGTWRNYVEEDNLAMEAKDIVYTCEAADVADEAYFDGQLAVKAIEDLAMAARQDKPFFLAVGFIKPHLPFNAPKKYWDLYDREKISLPDNYVLKNNSIPKAAFHNWGELRFYADMPKQGPVPEDDARKLIHGYRACVSYTDAQVGKVLAALERSGQADNTIILLFGDHGWSLGEHGEWCKHANFRTATNAPMIICAPGLEKGKTVEQVTEFVDIYPTLCRLAGLPLPAHLQGESLVPLMQGKTEGWKDVAAIQWGKGCTIVDNRNAYTVWRDTDGKFIAEMLFDHRGDLAENDNIAAQNATLVETMRAKLAKYTVTK